MKVVLLALGLFGLCSAQLRFGRCANPGLEDSFAPASFEGKGFLAKRTKKVPWDKNQCVKIQVDNIPGTTLDKTLFVSQYDLEADITSTTRGTLKFDDSSTLKGKVDSTWIPSKDFRIISAKSTPVNHSVFYSCVPFLFFWKREYLWVFVQNKSNVDNIDGILSSVFAKIPTISGNDLESVSQDANCKYVNSLP